MSEKRDEKWRDIANAIQSETNTQKLAQLVQELCDALDGDKNVLNDPRKKAKSEDRSDGGR